MRKAASPGFVLITTSVYTLLLLLLLQIFLSGTRESKGPVLLVASAFQLPLPINLPLSALHLSTPSTTISTFPQSQTGRMSRRQCNQKNKHLIHTKLTAAHVKPNPIIQKMSSQDNAESTTDLNNNGVSYTSSSSVLHQADDKNSNSKNKNKNSNEKNLLVSAEKEQEQDKETHQRHSQNDNLLQTSSSPNTTYTSYNTPAMTTAVANPESWNYWGTAYELSQAGLTGVVTGFLVAMFKLSIETVRNLCYEQDILVYYPWLLATIPAFGGAMVGLLLLVGGPMPPGLRGTVQDIDEQQSNLPSTTAKDQFQIQANFFRKSSAAVVTLGTGCSLGPEGPCVELGMNVARACTLLNPKLEMFVEEQQDGTNATILPQRQQQLQLQLQQRKAWNRILLSCGAAAGVAAGFNAPIAGVFFALEIMQNAFTALDNNQSRMNNAKDNPNTSGQQIMLWTSSISMTSTTTITPILISSVLSALVAQAFLGNQLVLVLTQYSLKTPLIELPLYLLLGALSGVTAFLFTYTAKVSQQFFDGDFGPQPVQNIMKTIPDPVKPMIGGLLCGLVGLAFPQILFFGYETLNSLLKNNSLPFTLILTLLGVKTLMTAISAGSGLVGGTFAPSLFLGAMVGAAFQETAAHAIQAWNNIHWEMISSSTTNGVVSTTTMIPQLHLQLQLAGTPAYAMVGAASVLAALFRAPLTASLLLFEVTRNYDVILPLMASAGVGSIVSDILEDTFERRDEMKRRDVDPVSWGDLADSDEELAILLANVEAEEAANIERMSNNVGVDSNSSGDHVKAD